MNEPMKSFSSAEIGVWRGYQQNSDSNVENKDELIQIYRKDPRWDAELDRIEHVQYMDDER